jgi:hypothetical protein
MRLRGLFMIASMTAGTLTMNGADLAPLRADCTMSASEDSGKFRLEIEKGDCADGHHCHSNFSTESISRFSGITLADLGRDGAKLTVTLNADAGTFTCSGTVRNEALEGTSVFTPSEAFVGKMDGMGYSGLDSEKLMAYALLGVDSQWVETMKRTGVRGITIDNLIALHIFKVDPEYIHDITSMGYEMPDADKLVGLKVQGVNAEEVRQIRAMGFKPTLDELIQIRIFHITPEFVKRMQERGLTNLTISKLVQIKIFKLDE